MSETRTSSCSAALALPFAVLLGAAVLANSPPLDASEPRYSAAVPADTALPSGKRMAYGMLYSDRFGIPMELALTIVDAAVAEGVDPELGFRLVRVESRFEPRARSKSNALGLAQIKFATARLLDRSLRSEAELFEPRTNLRLGFRFLRHMIHRYKGDVRLGLLAYNQGPNAVDGMLKRGANPENGYSHKVLGTKGDAPYRGKGLLKP